MKNKLLPILAITAIAPIASAITYTNTYSGGSGTVFANGAQIATFTVTSTLNTSTNITDTSGAVGVSIRGGHDAETTEVDVVITDSRFSLTSMRWSSVATGSHLGIGSSDTQISLDASGTVSENGTVAWTLGGSALIGSAAYTAGDILQTDNNDDTPEDAWVITASGLNQTLSYGGVNGASLSTENYEVEFSFVPEPSSAALLGLGGLALIARRRRA